MDLCFRLNTNKCMNIYNISKLHIYYQYIYFTSEISRIVIPFSLCYIDSQQYFINTTKNKS